MVFNVPWPSGVGFGGCGLRLWDMNVKTWKFFFVLPGALLLVTWVGVGASGGRMAVAKWGSMGPAVDTFLGCWCYCRRVDGVTGLGCGGGDGVFCHEWGCGGV